MRLRWILVMTVVAFGAVGSARAEAPAWLSARLNPRYGDRVTGRRAKEVSMALLKRTAVEGNKVTYEAMVRQKVGRGPLGRSEWRRMTFHGVYGEDSIILASMEKNPRERLRLELARATYSDPWTETQKRTWFTGTFSAKKRGFRGERIVRTPTRVDPTTRDWIQSYVFKYDPKYMEAPEVKAFVAE